VLSRDSASHVASDELTGYGIMVGSTAWLTSSDLFISTGSALMYILNRRLVSSLAIALPWLLLRIAGGYGRTAIIGHAMSLLAVWGMASPGVRNVVSSRVRQGTQLLLLFGGVAVIALVIFPAIGQNRGFFARGFNSETVNEALQVNQTAGDVAHSVGDLAGFETTLYFLQLDQPVWGTYYLYFYFLKPIPRAIFPDKGFPDTLAAKWFGVERDLRLSGQDSGCVGWAFQQWSWGGIVFEFLLTGWLFRKLEDWRDDFPDRLWVLLAYAGFFGILPQLGRDSVIVMIEDRWLFQYGIPCAVLWWIERTNRVRSYANQPMILSIGEATFPSERLPAPQGAPSETFG
jgi:hypothetical protein